VAFVVEAIDHHAVIAGAVLEQRRRLVAQSAKRRRRANLIERAGDLSGQVDRGPGAFEFDDQPARRRPMQQAVEFRARTADPTPHRDRHAL